MVTKKNKLDPLLKIYWPQVPGNKCIEFIIVHSPRTSAGCGSHVTWRNLGSACLSESLKKAAFL